MKILFLSVRSDIGGGPKHLLDLIRSSEFKNVEKYIGIPTNGEYFKDLSESSDSVLSIPFRKFSINSFFEILALCRKEKIDIIHSHGRGAGFYSRLLKLFGFKIIHTFHGVHIEKSLAGRIKLVLDKLLVPLTDKFICVSVSEKLNAIKHKVTSIKKTEVIHNGVIIPKDLVPLNNSTVTIGTLSRLNFQKGLDLLIETISKLEAKNNIDFKILIGGSGELEKELKEKNKSNKIEFLGNVDGQEFIKKIDIYLSFARWEGLPLAVIEAMSHRKPCLISKVEGNIDLIEDGADGLLFDLDNYEEFEEKFLQLLSDKNYGISLGEKARDKVIKSFSVDQMAHKTLQLYKSLIS